MKKAKITMLHRWDKSQTEEIVRMYKENALKNNPVFMDAMIRERKNK